MNSAYNPEFFLQNHLDNEVYEGKVIFSDLCQSGCSCLKILLISVKFNIRLRNSTLFKYANVDDSVLQIVFNHCLKTLGQHAYCL